MYSAWYTNNDIQYGEAGSKLRHRSPHWGLWNSWSNAALHSRLHRPEVTSHTFGFRDVKSPNRFDRMEWAGAFGDLGTLIPFVVAYIAVVKMDPFGVLFSLGASMLASGLYYKTPFPVQPMKAIGAAAATQAAQTATITQGTIYAASLVTGLVWLLLGLSGAARRVGRWVPRSVVVGIVLGLGLGFMLEGIKMMSSGWVIASIAMIGTLLLLKNKTVPAMFLLLLFGVVW